MKIVNVIQNLMGRSKFKWTESDLLAKYCRYFIDELQDEIRPTLTLRRFPGSMVVETYKVRMINEPFYRLPMPVRSPFRHSAVIGVEKERFCFIPIKRIIFSH